MAERLEEINRLYQNLSHEGWKSYRDTADLPTGFVFDQTGTKVVDDEDLSDNLFANIPMKVLGGEVVGMLTVANDPRNPTSAEDLAFFHQVSDQIALALEGARLTAQTQFALSQTEKLSDASLRFARAVDLQELIKIAVETLNIPKINRAVLETFNYSIANEVDSLDIVATWWNNTGKEPTAIGTHYTAASLPIIQLFITPTPLFINDTLNDKRIDNSTLNIVKLLSIRSIAILPLYLGVQQIGVLLLEAEESHDFKEEETRLFSAMGPQIATVLENRRQFERAQQQADRESTLNLISQKIQSATTVEAVLQIAARELGHALGAPMTIAQLSMKDKK
jgi:GAF domain-containing protein